MKLEDKEIRTEQALHHLDIKIRKYNQHHFFEIQTKGKNLTITVRSLLARFAAAERSKEHTLPTYKTKKGKGGKAILSGSVVASSIKIQNFKTLHLLSRRYKRHITEHSLKAQV